MSNERFIVQGDGTPREGTTDGGGLAHFEVAAYARDVRLTFPAHNQTFPMRVGDLDPFDEITGTRQRLHHLGHYHPMQDSCGDAQREADRLAFSSFQQARRLPITGVADDATMAALLDAHGV